MNYFYFESEKSYNYLLANAYKALKKSVDGKICMQLDSEETIGYFLEFIAKYLDKKNKTVLSKDSFDNCVKGAISKTARVLKARGEVEFYKDEEKEELKRQGKRVGLIKKVNYIYESNSYTNDEGEEISKLDSCIDVPSTVRFDSVNFDFLKIHLSKVFNKEEMKLFVHIFEEGGHYYDEEILGFSNTKGKKLYTKILSYINDNKEFLFEDYRPNTTYNGTKYREGGEEQKKYFERLEEEKQVQSIEINIESIDTQVFLEEYIDNTLQD